MLTNPLIIFVIISLTECQTTHDINDEFEMSEEVESRIDFETLCDKIDGSVQTSDKKMYFFGGQYYWQINRDFQILSAPTYIQNKWGFLIKTPLDAVFTFNKGRFASKTIFISGNHWWRVNANGRTEAGNDIQWEGWPTDRTADTAFVWDATPLKARTQSSSLVFFLFGPKYSVYRFGSDEKAMLTPTPVVVMADAVVSDADNELLFLNIDPSVTANRTARRTLDSLLKVTASMNVIDDNSLYLFGKENKFCKISAKDNRFVCEVNRINELLKCNTDFSNVPKAEPSLVNDRSKSSDAGLTDYYNSGTQLQQISLAFIFFCLSLLNL